MSLHPFLALPLLLLLGCPADPDKPDDDTGFHEGCDDQDGDGFCTGEDCDDTDPDVHPDKDEESMEPDHVDNDCDGIIDECSEDDPDMTWWTEEVCDGVDNDCDGDVDEGLAGTYYPDADGDGFGDALLPVKDCGAPGDYVEDGSDCDDADAAVHPGATEVCNGVDDDCDAGTSEDGLVTADGSENHETIQGALDDAEEGGTVTVCVGSSAEALTISQSVSLEAPLGAAATELLGDGTGSVIYVEGGVVYLSGFTITGGVGTQLSSDSDETGGGGVLGVGAAELTIEDCVITANSADYGGGVLGPTDGVLYLLSSTISDNQATTAGGGVWLKEGVFEAVEVQDNSCDTSGGGMYHYQNTLSLTDVTFSGNSAEYGGAFRAYGDIIEAKGVVVEGNSATSYGGGIYMRNDSFITGVEVRGNEAEYGAGIYCREDCNLLDSVIEDNVASGYGGGLMCRSGTLLLQEVTLDANEAIGGAGLLMDECDADLATVTVSASAASYGAGAYLVDSQVEADDDVVFSGNVAESYGGGAYVYSNSTWDGGVVQDNEAASGGGLCLYDTAVLDDIELSGNIATDWGGGLYLRSDADLEGLLVDGNSATYGGGIYLYSDSEVWLDGSTVTSNTASERGGGIRVSAGILYITDTDLGEDKADNDPDDVYAGGTAYMGYASATDMTCSGSEGCTVVE